MAKSIVSVYSVWRRQSRNWRMVSIQSLFRKFFERLTQAYNNIYIMKLGADPVQLGIVNSFSSISGAIISAPVGWLQDRYSLRKIFIIGFTASLIVSLTYGLATSWVTIIFAMTLSALVLARTSGAPAIGSCQTICDVSVKPEDRSTCKGVCDGFFSIPSLIVPSLAALLVTYFGGMSVEGIRPLYWIQSAAFVVILIFLATQLSEIERSKVMRKRSGLSSFIEDYREVFRRGVALKRWIIFSVVDSFVMTMVNPFTQPFAYEVKKADQFILGWMTTASLLTPTLISPFFGSIADRSGRKRVLYMVEPLYWVSLMMLAFAPEGSSTLLIISALFGGFRQVAGYTVTVPLMVDLIPVDCVGRWRGVLGVIGGLAAIPAPIIGGILWETIGPHYLILIPLVIDMLFRLPLLSTIPEKPRLR